MSAASGLGLLLAAMLAAGLSRVPPPWPSAPVPLYDGHIALNQLPAFWYCAVADGLLLASAVVLQNLALRDITSTHVALTLLLQVVLSPLCVFVVLGIRPSGWTIVGGAFLLLVLALHEAFGMQTAAAATTGKHAGKLGDGSES